MKSVNLNRFETTIVKIQLLTAKEESRMETRDDGKELSLNPIAAKVH